MVKGRESFVEGFFPSRMIILNIFWVPIIPHCMFVREKKYYLKIDFFEEQ